MRACVEKYQMRRKGVNKTFIHWKKKWAGEKRREGGVGGSCCWCSSPPPPQRQWRNDNEQEEKKYVSSTLTKLRNFPPSSRGKKNTQK